MIFQKFRKEKLNLVKRGNFDDETFKTQLEKMNYFLKKEEENAIVKWMTEEKN